MQQRHMSLIRNESRVSMTSLQLLQAGGSPLAIAAAPKRVHVLSNESEKKSLLKSNPFSENENIRSSLSMTSRMSFFQDRILSPEVMRAMVLLYLNNSPIPYNVVEDMYLSPLDNVPTDMLERFPPVYFITGEKDPFVDDTIVFASRIRCAKEEKNNRIRGGFKMTPQSPMKIPSPKKRHEAGEHGVVVMILEGISHGFFQM